MIVEQRSDGRDREPKRVGQPLESGKDKVDSLLEPPRDTLLLTLAPSDPFQSWDLQHSNKNLCVALQLSW